MASGRLDILQKITRQILKLNGKIVNLQKRKDREERNSREYKVLDAEQRELERRVRELSKMADSLKKSKGI